MARASSKAKSKTAKKPSSRRTPSKGRRKDVDSNEVRIVAIGASAGGLEPIAQFFDANPPQGAGICYVIVQHLSPDFKSMMPELLGRHSDLKIRRVEDGMYIESDVIYLNPPRTSIEIDGNVFKLHSETDPKEFNLPINSFFESLARHAGRRVISIVMSGTGSDGTIGSQAVAAAGGTVMAQDPITARFESMPRSVVENVTGSLFASPAQLARFVERVVKGECIEALPDQVTLNLSAPEREIIRQLQSRFGLDFGYYKTTTVGRRIKRRSQLAKQKSLAEYAVALAHDSEELEALYIDLLIGVTAFFRDKAAFDLLAAKVISELGTRMAKGREIRVWVPGCASGEEVYSIAILIAERARIIGCELKVRIFATDIHPRSLQVASRGVYSSSILETVPSELRERYFAPVGDQWQLKKQVREAVVFSKHNLIRDPPFTRLDLVSCRNLLIYLDEEAQRKAIAMFHFSLRQGGTLFLGPSESLGELSEEFDVTDSRWRIFRKRRNVRLVEATRLLPLSSRSRHETGEANVVADGPNFTSAVGLQRQSVYRVYDAVLSKVVGTSLLVASNGEVQHVFGDAGRFLKFRSGQFSRQLNDLIDGQLRLTVNAGFDRVVKHDEGDFNRLAAYHREDRDERMMVDVAICRIDPGGQAPDRPVLITLTEVKPQKHEVTEDVEERPPYSSDLLVKRIGELERDLRFSEETLQTTIEELETSNEELQATNEELQATNEEMMAANEELQTVNEELHAVNEELFTVSSEHQTKISELTSLTGDLDNLLASTSIGVLFLDSALQIRRVTPAVSDAFNILERDIGRPIEHVTSRFEFPDLVDTVKRVIENGSMVERNVQVEGRDFQLRVLPYRQEDKIDGAVLTFVDISEIARANRSLAQFADIVSHDLRAPLRAIRNAGQWIIEDLRDDPGPEVKEHVSMLVEHTERLDRMLSDLREFSHMQGSAGRAELVDVKAELEEIGRLYSSDLLDLELDPGLPELETTRAAMRLVLQNIIDNAVKHSDEKPVKVKVTIDTDHGSPQFTISDNGPGIHPRHHDRIFLPFRKLKTDGASGSGIGLALVKKAVTDRGGSIEVISDPAVARGTTFRFTWPN